MKEIHTVPPVFFSDHCYQLKDANNCVKLICDIRFVYIQYTPYIPPI